MKRFLTPPRRNHRGMALIQGAIAIVVLTCMCSLSVDIGIYYMAKLQLQRAADAAALAGAADLHDGADTNAATQQAIAYAEANSITGETLTASAIDVRFGSWKSNAFVPGGSPSTVIKVVLKRTLAGGNPVRLYFGQFIGLSSIDVEAVSYARTRVSVPEFNLVGIDHASFGSIGVLATIKGRFVSNGDVYIGMPLGILVGVQGDARSWGGTTKRGLLASISGSTANLDDQLVYPSVTLPPSNDNTKIAAYLDGSNNFTCLVAANIPAGTYVVHDLNLIAGVAVNLQGPVTFYVTHDCNIAASVNLLGSSSFSAENFKVRVQSGGHVNFLANILTPLNMDMYAPDSNINVAVGVSAYKGRLIGKTLDIMLPLLGSFTEEYNLSDPIDPGPAVSLVRASL
ncbi:MAG: TadG family pilus assembly protein [Tepidisphaeraceae bacterium]